MNARIALVELTVDKGLWMSFARVYVSCLVSYLLGICYYMYKTAWLISMNEIVDD